MNMQPTDRQLAKVVRYVPQGYLLLLIVIVEARTFEGTLLEIFPSEPKHCEVGGQFLFSLHSSSPPFLRHAPILLMGGQVQGGEKCERVRFEPGTFHTADLRSNH